MTGDLDKEDRRAGGRGTTLGRGSRDAAAASTSDRARRVFCQPFPSYLRRDRSHAGARLGWPTPVRWERAVHREGRAAV
jgi:hypothetical protein